MTELSTEKKNNTCDTQMETQSYNKVVLWPELEEGYVPVPSEFRFIADGMHFRIELANTREQKAASFRFMYDIYREKDWGTPHSSGMHFSLYEIFAESTTLVVIKDEHELVGTITVAPDSPIFGLPDDENYKDILDVERAKGRRMAEVISLGIRSDVRGVREIILKLFNFAYFVARGIRECTDFVITVLPHHTPFYARKMLFKAIGEPRWQKKTGVIVELLKLDFEDAEKETLSLHGVLGNKPEKSTTIYGDFFAVCEVLGIIEELKHRLMPIKPDDFQYFLSLRPELKEKLKNEN